MENRSIIEEVRSAAEQSTRIRVTLSDGREFTARVEQVTHTPCDDAGEVVIPFDAKMEDVRGIGVGESGGMTAHLSGSDDWVGVTATWPTALFRDGTPAKFDGEKVAKVETVPDADTPEEIIETLRRAFHRGAVVRVEATDGRWIRAGIESIINDRPLAEETDEEPPEGWFRVGFWYEHMIGVRNWECDGAVSVRESEDGSWQQPQLGWTTETDEEGYRVEQYWCDVQTVEVVSDE